MESLLSPTALFQKFYELKRDEFNLKDIIAASAENLTNGEFKFIECCINNFGQSNSQILQDLFVLYALDFKQNGFFVEFGAVDGLYLSNTYLLETKYNWCGLLSEPSKKFQEALSKNRKCNIEHKCIWSHSNETLEFTDTEVIGLSTISEFKDSDTHFELRNNSQKYEVSTITLNDALDYIGYNGSFDYLSIDTEGSEFTILESHDYERHSPVIITCEHNFQKDKQNEVFELLAKKGYVRVFEKLSLFEDWYIRKDYFEAFKAKFL